MTGEFLVSAFGRPAVSAAWVGFAGTHIRRGAEFLFSQGMSTECLMLLSPATIHDVGALVVMQDLQAAGVVGAVNGAWTRSWRFFTLGIELLLQFSARMRKGIDGVPGFSPIGAWACRFHLLHSAWYDTNASMRRTYFAPVKLDETSINATAEVLMAMVAAKSPERMNTLEKCS